LRGLCPRPYTVAEGRFAYWQGMPNGKIRETGGQDSARSIGCQISFDDIRSLLHHLGFEERIRGSHRIFRKAGIEEKINLQRDGAKAKPYQVKQVRNLILKYHMTGGG
jgi:hypothetical protein